MENPETMATPGTQDEAIQKNRTKTMSNTDPAKELRLAVPASSNTPAMLHV